MMFKNTNCSRSVLAGLIVAALSGPVSAAVTSLTLDFDDLGLSAVGGSPIETYQGFRFDQGSYFVTALGNNSLITTNALVISRDDGSAFNFYSVDYAARGGETREYYFLYDFAGGGTFSGANLNASDSGNFKTSVGSIETELSGTDQLISRLVVVGKQTETADYTYLALDNLRVGVQLPSPVSAVPEPATIAMFGVGIAMIGFKRRQQRKV